MRKLLTYCLTGATLLLAGCSTMEQVGDAVPAALENTPLMFKPDIQQGKVVDQGVINRLRPGMSKSQVNYLMGSPMLVDLFHLDRWDYVYTMKRGKQQRTQQRVTLYFEDDQLVRIEGDLRPGTEETATELQEAQVYDVPDNDGPGRGIFSRALNTVGLEGE